MAYYTTTEVRCSLYTSVEHIKSYCSGLKDWMLAITYQPFEMTWYPAHFVGKVPGAEIV